ncbi:hypothetical protein HYH02_013621 [Chlamydomonas schloesseri]|uniref:Uncharacterized protein n=1 Tax=Chlamydomonas schloesseri TaxID=2026947 RepID=A0A835VVE7_9CHLO|nr:hypothetical protein HYH02_013621 [Chlamydomonas schloesseri]|eukprot:KAG2430782.1 hypothetical protein HYH02_013621 [Chlamydomonas schloesseri]
MSAPCDPMRYLATAQGRRAAPGLQAAGYARGAVAALLMLERGPLEAVQRYSEAEAAGSGARSGLAMTVVIVVMP